MTDERMSDEKLEELHRIYVASVDYDVTHLHWFPNVYIMSMLDEIDRARKAEEALKAENEKLREELEWYQREVFKTPAERMRR